MVMLSTITLIYAVFIKSTAMNFLAGLSKPWITKKKILSQRMLGMRAFFLVQALTSFLQSIRDAVPNSRHTELMTKVNTLQKKVKLLLIKVRL